MQEFEQAAVFRNRLRAVRSLFQRQRIASGTVGTLDVLAVAVEGTEANAQVFQVRDGVLADRQSFYLENRAGRSEDEVAEEFAIQYYSTSLSIPGEIVGPASLAEADVVKQALEERREAPVELRHAQRGEKRRLYELAERNARLAIEQDKLRSERRRQQRVDALNDLREALGMDALPVRIEGYDISNLGSSHTVASMVVFEGGAPRKADYRRFKIRKLAGRQDDFAAMQEVLARRMARWVEQRDLSPHDPDRDRSFAALPALIVIDGGKGQLSSGVARARRVHGRGRRGREPREAPRGDICAGPLPADRAAAGFARPPAAPANPRRSTPLRRGTPPPATHTVHEEVGPRRAARGRAGAQAHAAPPFRLAGAIPRSDAGGAGSGPGVTRERWLGRFTSS